MQLPAWPLPPHPGIMNEDATLVGISNDVLGNQGMGIVRLVKMDWIPSQLSSLSKPLEGYTLNGLHHIWCVKDNAVRSDIVYVFHAFKHDAAAELGDLCGKHWLSHTFFGCMVSCNVLVDVYASFTDGGHGVKSVTTVAHAVTGHHDLIAWCQTSDKTRIQRDRFGCRIELF